jgi:DNA polymerase (family X)
MTALDASAIAALLREFGQRSALRGGNPFRAKAYGRAADNLLALSLPLDQIIAQDRLREIPGIGDAIADIIKKLQATGTHPALEKMRKEIPSGVLEMLTIPGLRADKVIKLYQELGLTSLEELEQAAREGRLQTVKGLGASLQTKVLSGIELRREARGRRHMHKADELLRSPKSISRRRGRKSSESQERAISVGARSLRAIFRLSPRWRNCRRPQGDHGGRAADRASH